MRRASSSAGFTLVELVVTIAVMGIVAAVAVLVVGSNDGTNSACKTDFQKIQVAQENFYARSNRYASSIGELMTPPATPSPSARAFVRESPGSSKYQIVTDSSGTVSVLRPPSPSAVATATTTAGCPS